MTFIALQGVAPRLLVEHATVAAFLVPGVVLAGVGHGSQHGFLALGDLALVLSLHPRDVHPQHRVAEHADRDVDEVHLGGREDLVHLGEDAEALIDVALAVGADRSGELLAPIEHAQR